MTTEQSQEIKMRCIEAAARLFTSYQLEGKCIAREVVIRAASDFYSWVINPVPQVNETEIS